LDPAQCLIRFFDSDLADRVREHGLERTDQKVELFHGKEVASDLVMAQRILCALATREAVGIYDAKEIIPSYYSESQRSSDVTLKAMVDSFKRMMGADIEEVDLNQQYLIEVPAEADKFRRALRAVIDFRES
jgi:hypothetical protein